MSFFIPRVTDSDRSNTRLSEKFVTCALLNAGVGFMSLACKIYQLWGLLLFPCPYSAGKLWEFYRKHMIGNVMRTGNVAVLYRQAAKLYSKTVASNYSYASWRFHASSAIS